MQTAATIGLDIAKKVFQVHGIRPEGHMVFRRQLQRGRVLTFFKKLKPCLVGIFSCRQTSTINAIRAHLAEFGVIAPLGRRCVSLHEL